MYYILNIHPHQSTSLEPRIDRGIPECSNEFSPSQIFTICFALKHLLTLDSDFRGYASTSWDRQSNKHVVVQNLRISLCVLSINEFKLNSNRTGSITNHTDFNCYAIEISIDEFKLGKKKKKLKVF